MKNSGKKLLWNLKYQQQQKIYFINPPSLNTIHQIFDIFSLLLLYHEHGQISVQKSSSFETWTFSHRRHLHEKLISCSCIAAEEPKERFSVFWTVERYGRIKKTFNNEKSTSNFILVQKRERARDEEWKNTVCQTVMGWIFGEVALECGSRVRIEVGSEGERCRWRRCCCCRSASSTTSTLCSNTKNGSARWESRTD